MASEGHCCGGGPGYATPLDAMKGPREEILYVPCIVPKADRPDYLAVVDINPKSNDYLKVIHRAPVPNVGDEMHHMNWNSCSSCFGDPSKKRDKLILPCLLSDRIYTFDLSQDMRAPRLFATVDPEAMHGLNVSSPHTPHCLPGGDVMVSTMGDKHRNSQGSFILLDGKTFKPKSGGSVYGDKKTGFGYDYWYQPRHDVMVSSEWGAPSVFENGFNPAHLSVEGSGDKAKYGQHIHFWKWSTGELIQSVDLGPEGLMPLETRFLHNPDKTEGYVGCAISSSVFHFWKCPSSGEWKVRKVIALESPQVNKWCLPQMPHVITDIIISLDDKFLYFSCWLTGEVRQYNIEDTANPKLVGLCKIGGCIQGDVTLEDGSQPPQPELMGGKRLRGGPQMLQLSLDGKRMYLTTSLFSRWDAQFFPEMFEKGSMLIRLNVNTNEGGLEVDDKFLVDFGDEPQGPVLAHEIRYPGGDCSSDIWS